MSDEDERERWHKAYEVYPEVVRWLEARLRRGAPIAGPLFMHTTNGRRMIPPGAWERMIVVLPAASGAPDVQIVGVSLFLLNVGESERKAMSTVAVPIRFRAGTMIEANQTMGVLMAPEQPEGLFVPGWVCDVRVGGGGSNFVEAEIANTIGRALYVDLSVHLNFIPREVPRGSEAAYVHDYNPRRDDPSAVAGASAS